MKKSFKILLATVILAVAALLFAVGVSAEEPSYSLSYSTHLSNIGWISAVNEGETSGYNNYDYAVEALKVNFSSTEDLHIKYSAHVSNIGWTPDLDENSFIGTTGRALHIEAIKVELTGSDAEKYDILYRSNVQDSGYLGWARNGEISGSTGIARSLLGIEIKIAPKGSEPQSTIPTYKDFDLLYQTHLSNIGWTGVSRTGAASGTYANNFEAYSIYSTNLSSAGVYYGAHVSDIGWQNPVQNGAVSGTTGQAKSIEAFYIGLTGPAADQYDIWYRAYVSGYGWLGFAKNGELAGTSSLARPILALQINILLKDTFTPENIPAYKNGEFYYQSYLSNCGWTVKAENEQYLGYGDSRYAYEGLIISLRNSDSVGVNYGVHVSNVGWMPAVSGGNVAGMPGSGNSIEAFYAILSGNDADKYDLWYRTLTEGHGWLGWASNGKYAGTSGYGEKVLAVQMKLCNKGEFSPEEQDCYIEKPRTILFVIDAGHGGNDPGATGCDGRYEANDNIKYASEVIRVLNQQGYATYLINRTLKTENRPLEANATNGDIFVSLHRDSSGASARGISIYTHEPTHYQRTQQPEKTYAPAEYGNKHAVDTILVNTLAANLNGIAGMPLKGVFYGSASAPTWEDYFINRLSNMPSCIVELGFVSNATDNAIFDANYKLFAKAIAKALIETVGGIFDEAIYTQ